MTATAMPQLPIAVTRRIFARGFSLGAGARLIDPFHDMAVTLRHDGRQITAIRGRILRFPWTTCPEATGKLAAFIGAPIDPSLKVQHSIAQNWQCTHLMDLARFALRQASSIPARDYHITVTAANPARPEAIIAQAVRNGQIALCLHILHGQVISPAEFLGFSMNGTARLSEDIRADVDLLEALMMLRRAVLVFHGSIALRATKASEMPQMLGACYSFQPVNAARARRAGPGNVA